jgi:hypothetical protein
VACSKGSKIKIKKFFFFFFFFFLRQTAMMVNVAARASSTHFFRILETAVGAFRSLLHPAHWTSHIALEEDKRMTTVFGNIRDLLCCSLYMHY